MSRPYYSEYVRHALRFYARTCMHDTIPAFKTESDELNWCACNRVLQDYDPKTKDILLTVYAGYDTLPDEVYNASKKFKMQQNHIWDDMKVLEREVATKRGLI